MRASLIWRSKDRCILINPLYYNIFIFIIIQTLPEHAAYTRLPQDKEMLQRQIQATDDQIDRLVFELYGLTEDEIKIVEGN